MKKISTLISIGMVAIISFSSCLVVKIDTSKLSTDEKYIDSDSMLTQTFNVDTFSKIETSSAIKLEVKKASQQKVEVITNLPMRYIKAQVTNQKLQVSYQNLKGKFKNIRTAVTVYTPDFEELQVTGASKITIEEGFMLKNLRLILNSAGQISGNINANRLEVEANSAAVLQSNITVKELKINARSASITRLSGNTEWVHVKASSAAKVLLGNLTYQNIEIEKSSAASVVTKK